MCAEVFCYMFFNFNQDRLIYGSLCHTSTSSFSWYSLGILCVKELSADSSCAGQLSADTSSTETLYCFIISVQRLEVVYKMAAFCRFDKVLEELLMLMVIKFLVSQDEGHLRFLDLK